MRVVLKPIIHKDSYNEPLESEIFAYFKETIFDPIYELLETAGAGVRVNSVSALRVAIQSGKIWYEGGKFHGKFSAAISRDLRALGATPSGTAFEIQLSALPIGLRSLISQAKLGSDQLHARILATLDQMQQNLSLAGTGIKLSTGLTKVVTDLQAQFSASISDVKDDLSISSAMTPDIQENLRKNLIENTEIGIKTWAPLEVANLRHIVQENLHAGGRVDRIQELLQTQYGVAQRKARFIAENEMSLAVSKYREERYTAIGCRRYEWSTHHDEKERKDHKKLDRRIFEYSNPPIVDRATGRRRNPGEDYNCRCVGLPILEFPS